MQNSLWRARFPWSLLAIVVLLAALGWLGIARVDEISGTPGRYLTRQIGWSAVGLVALLAMTLPSYRALGRWSYVAFALSLVLLIAVYFFPPINGARRWIRFGPIGLQPSEFAKVAFVVALARYLMYRENYRTLRGLLVPFAVALVPMVLILREPDLGTSLVFVPVLFLMLYVAGARLRDLAIVASLGLLVAPLLWTQMSREQRSRVTGLFEQTAPRERTNDDTFHLHQAKQMLALGGAFGSWIAGDEALDAAAVHLPEAQTDFIFSVIGERLGLVGAALVLLLYSLLVWRGMTVACETREPFGRLVAAGVAGLIGCQVLINTSMTVGLAPVTGLSLPFVSHGGSGMLAHALAVGLLANIAMRPGYEVTREPFRFATAS
jgi:rod shape determining protein RodA